MSIFNFRRGRPANESAPATRASASAAESVEMVRKRARQRLIGSAVLVLLGVIGFPLLFETQPRPVPVDIAIEIPSRASVKPGSPIQQVSRSDAPDAPELAAKTPVADAPSAPPAPASPSLPAQASLQEREEIVEPAPANVPVAAAPAAPIKPPAVVDPKPAQAALVAKPEPRPQPQPKPDDGQRAKALLEGASVQPGEGQSRIVVQVGAFADPAKAREARAKLEKAGLKTYTQMADTKDGTRIRVRLGPYASKAEAEKAAAKVKSLNLPAAVLVL